MRFPQPGVAVVSCSKHISDEREPAAREPDAPLAARGATTFVLVRQEGGWRIALIQTTPIATPD